MIIVQYASWNCVMTSLFCMIIWLLRCCWVVLFSTVLFNFFFLRSLWCNNSIACACIVRIVFQRKNTQRGRERYRKAHLRHIFHWIWFASIHFWSKAIETCYGDCIEWSVTWKCDCDNIDDLMFVRLFFNDVEDGHRSATLFGFRLDSFGWLLLLFFSLLSWAALWFVAPFQ